jgi:glutamyl/glutaminyl-tRNA synthetase
VSATGSLAARLGTGWRTRFAPAPTGWLHLGHVLNAAVVWGLARAHRGHVVVRIEDHDRRRCRPEFESALREDLHWLGFAADEEAPPQRERSARYADVLGVLTARGLAYPCACSRREISGGTPERHLELVYPGTCRGRQVDPASTVGRRVVLAEQEQQFDDLRLGAITQIPARQCGDLLVRDRDGQWTYQYAVTVDDLDQGIDVIIRGEDLLPSTGRQLQLASLIGRVKAPRFLHHALIRHPEGEKLSKSRGDTGVREMRAQGASAAHVIGAALYAGGLIPVSAPVEVASLAPLLQSRAIESVLFAASARSGVL